MLYLAPEAMYVARKILLPVYEVKIGVWRVLQMDCNALQWASEANVGASVAALVVLTTRAVGAEISTMPWEKRPLIYEPFPVVQAPL